MSSRSGIRRAGFSDTSGEAYSKVSLRTEVSSTSWVSRPANASHVRADDRKPCTSTTVIPMDVIDAKYPPARVRCEPRPDVNRAARSAGRVDTRAGPGAPAAATLAGELLTAVRAPVVGATQIPPQGHAGEEAGEADQGGECDGAGHRRGPRSARRLSSPRRSSAGSSSAREV